MHLRPMLESDVDAVFTIESAVAEFPWSWAQFKECLTAKNDCSVLTNKNNLYGFIIFSRVLDETTLLDIAVSPDYQRRGYGRHLLEQGLKHQAEAGTIKCFLEVRVSNQKAQSLYRSIGFTVVGERKNYYPAKPGRENALVMCRDLSAAPLAIA